MACGTLENLAVSYDEGNGREYPPLRQEFPSGLDFPRLSTFKYRKYVRFARRQRKIRSVLNMDGIPSVIESLSAHARRLRTVILSYEYPLLPTSPYGAATSGTEVPPSTDRLQNLLAVLKELGSDLDEQLSSPEFGKLERVEFEFMDHMTPHRSVTQHQLHIFISLVAPASGRARYRALSK
ncbi:hypothetical protein OH76DRAFT_948136 [Lentinus brumalis]|uniref:Uncharacterized protein n=1 Tax=Lentinus brumalis TaxID=2498619 RepID=A0A371CZ52_9APHY|nr:hypothetical protein OH76DRAFT_948136 [Polyporus brumalis]